MIWQDFVIGLASVVFAFALIPMIRQKAHPPPLMTSVPTATGLWAITISLGSLSLWFSCAVTMMTAILWTRLAQFGWRERHD